MMGQDEILGMDLHTAAQSVSTGEVSPVELVGACLDQAAVLADTNAFISVFDDALEVAEASGAMIGAGYRIGPLHGVPVALKDNINVASPLRMGSPKLVKAGGQANVSSPLVGPPAHTSAPSSLVVRT